MTYHSGMKFSTKDRDHDKYRKSCSHNWKGAWWYNVCHQTNPNGHNYNSKSAPNSEGIIYRDWKGFNHSMKSIRMAIKAL